MGRLSSVSRLPPRRRPSERLPFLRAEKPATHVAWTCHLRTLDNQRYVREECSRSNMKQQEFPSE
jgi:hypothetical protein